MRPHIVLISTGGTIGMLHDPKRHGAVPAVDGRALVAAIPSCQDFATVEVLEFSNIPSFHLTPELMLSLAKETHAALSREEVHGVVITHGTDTLEETAYFLELVLPCDKPVCLTGAMRVSGHVAPDGPYNLLCAIKAASCLGLAGYGPVVVMNEEIHAARRVVKTHTASVSTFASPGWGPLGRVEENVIILSPPLKRSELLRPDSLRARVPILKAYTGMDNDLLEAVEAMHPDGLVLEGFGRGNLPAHIVPVLVRLLNSGIPIVVASRVLSGPTAGVYATEGGGANLNTLGVLHSGLLSSHKARLKLLLALSCGYEAKQVAALFSDDMERVDDVNLIVQP